MAKITRDELRALDAALSQNPRKPSHGGIPTAAKNFFAEATNLPDETYWFRINREVLAERLGYIEGGLETLFARTAVLDYESIARAGLAAAFNEAIDNVSDEFFADKGYRAQILLAVEKLTIDVVASETSWEVTIDFEELGSYEDFTKGFHRGALLHDSERKKSDGRYGRVRLPYGGERLRSTEEKRTKFWEALLTGTEYKTSNNKRVPTEGLLDPTITDRVNTWYELEKAPEWLLLEYGTMKSIPAIPPQDVSGRFYTLTAQAINSAVVTVAREIIAEAEAMGVISPTFEATAAGNEAAAMAAYERYKAQGRAVSLVKLHEHVYGIIGKGGFQKIYE